MDRIGSINKCPICLLESFTVFLSGEAHRLPETFKYMYSNSPPFCLRYFSFIVIFKQLQQFHFLPKMVAITFENAKVLVNFMFVLCMFTIKENKHIISFLLPKTQITVQHLEKLLTRVALLLDSL